MLFKRTVYGVSDTFSRFAGSVGKGLAVITMDEKVLAFTILPHINFLESVPGAETDVKN